jgi:hypothetical protein
MNKPDSGRGYGQCYVNRITPIGVERSPLLQEQRSLGILPTFYSCEGPLCKHPTKPKSQIRIEAWLKRVGVYSQND